MASEIHDLRMAAKHILRMTAKTKCGISTSNRYADDREATFADDRQKVSVYLLPAITKYVCGRPRTARMHTHDCFCIRRNASVFITSRTTDQRVKLARPQRHQVDGGGPYVAKKART